MNNITTELILHPKIEKLKRELFKAREKLAEIIGELDEKQLIEAPALSSSYHLIFAELERDVYASQVDLSRQRRKLEYLRSSINKKTIFDPAEVDSRLDQEFEEYLKRVESYNKSLQNALFFRDHSHSLSEKDEKELKKLYHQLVKKLHPDLNPDNNAQDYALLEKVMKAYQCGDLDTLQSLNEIQIPESTEIDTAEALTEKISITKKQIEKMEEKIKTLETVFPFSHTCFLNEPEKSERILTCQKLIQQNKALLKHYQLQYESLLAQYHPVIH